MFERVDYIVARIDGDYAYLRRIDEAGVFIPGEEEKCVARALLPPELSEGSHLIYEMMQYHMA